MRYPVESKLCLLHSHDFVYLFQVKRLVLVPGIRMVGFGVNARINVFPQTKETTQKILHQQFVTEKMIVVAPFMVSLLFLRNVKILSRQIIQHLMKSKKMETPVLQNVLRVKFSAYMIRVPHCL